MVGLVILVVLLVMYWYWKIPGYKKLKRWIANGVCCPATLQKYAAMPRLGRLWNTLVFSYKKHLKTKFNLAVSFYQVSSLLHSSYQVPFPYEYLHFMDQSKFLSVDVTKYAFPAASCIPDIGPISFATKLYSLGIVACVIYAGAWALIKSSAEKAWAQEALSWLCIVLFLLYPSFTTVFFDALKCRVIDGQPYVTADVSVLCTGEEYAPLLAVSWALVALWACGLPAIATGVLWPARSELCKGDSPAGFQKHLRTIYSPYKPSLWFFEMVEYTKKLLVVGIIPAISSSTGSYLAGAVAALLITNIHVALLLALTPFAHKADQLLSVVFNALLSIIILMSIMLKLSQGHLVLNIGYGLDPDTASGILIGANVLVVVMSVAGYCISTWQEGLFKTSQAKLKTSIEMPLLGILEEQGVLQPAPQWEWQEIDAQDAGTDRAEDQAVLHELGDSLGWPYSGVGLGASLDLGLPAGTTAGQIVRSLVAEKLQRMRQQFPSASHADLCDAMVTYSPHNWLCHKGHVQVQHGDTTKGSKYQGELAFGSHQDFHHGAVAVLGPIIGETSVLAAMVREVLEQGDENDRYNLWYLLFCTAVEQPEFKDSGQPRVDKESGKPQMLDDGHGGMRLADFTRQVNETLESSGSNNTVTDAGMLALRLYSVSTYASMNGALRAKGRELMEGALQNDRLRFQACIQSARRCLLSMQAIPRPHVETYRSVNGYLGGEFEKNDIGLDYAFISATTQKAEALKFSNGADLTVLFTIAYVGSCPGADISPISVYPGQKEVLFPPCTGFSLAIGDNERGQIAGKGAGHALVKVIPAAAR
jgi:hypothetical protein